MSLKGFKRFKKRGRSTSPWVGIRKNGQIVFNSGAVSKYDLDVFTHVIFYISDDKKRIAVKFSNNDAEEGAHPVQSRPGAFQVSCLSFLNLYDIHWDENRTFKFTWVKEEYTAIFRLDEPFQSITIPSNRI